MQKQPAAFDRQVVPVHRDQLSECDWHALPETNTTLIPDVNTITCELVGSHSPEKMEFSFVQSRGKLRAKHSRRAASTFDLTTGKDGAIYYLEYETRAGIQESIGRWCGWSMDLEAPSIEQLLPDENGNVHVKSDGGLVYRTAWRTDEPIRGLAFVYCGLGGLQHASKILGTELIQEGWAVVYLYTVLNAPKYNARFKLTEENPAKSLVKIFDKKYCQVIASTKAIRQLLEHQVPTLHSLPLVLIGISAGALNTPAVYHEMKDDVDAVVLIAGGANMFEIVQEGAFTNWKFSMALTPYNDYEEYLAIPSRDPYHLAPELPLNTLIVHAKWDRVVPAANGDLLWERAGKPERWIFSGGHLGLFVVFDWYADDIVNWIESHTQ